MLDDLVLLLRHGDCVSLAFAAGLHTTAALTLLHACRFGAFQQYYEDVTLSNRTPSEISWIGSLQLCLVMLVGASLLRSPRSFVRSWLT